jgi:hypothetical protein
MGFIDTYCNHLRCGLLIFFNFNFHLLKDHSWWNAYQNLSKTTGAWGEFGDYVGGILNPIIAFFAFYLIKITYQLQKKELEATRNLLKISNNAQHNQIKLAALTALLNSNLVHIDLLKSEKASLLNGKVPKPDDTDSQSNENSPEFNKACREVRERNSPEARRQYRIQDIDTEIADLTKKNDGLIERIENFLK